MLGWIHEKMTIQKSAPEGGRFSTFDLIVARNNTSSCNDLCVSNEDCSTVVGNNSWDNVHTSNSSSRGERPGKKPNVLVQRAQRTVGSLDG
jgi:hypothetical protein